MKPPGRTNALLVCGLALFFSWAFFFLKHDPQFRDIIPFAVLRTPRRMPSVLRWTFVVLLGLGVGFAALFLEIRESAAIPVGRLLLIASVYAYCGLSGLLIAYAFLRKPLGFLSPD